MADGEVEEAAEAEQLALQARVAPVRRLAHRVANTPVQVSDQLVEDLLLGAEVQVERPLPDAGRLGDLHDRGVVVAEIAEDLLGRLEETLARLRCHGPRACARTRP